MVVPDKRVKNVAINKKVTIIVRQMINVSLSVQYLCTIITVEKITRFVGSVLVIFFTVVSLVNYFVVFHFSPVLLLR